MGVIFCLIQVARKLREMKATTRHKASGMSWFVIPRLEARPIVAGRWKEMLIKSFTLVYENNSNGDGFFGFGWRL